MTVLGVQGAQNLLTRFRCPVQFCPSKACGIVKLDMHSGLRRIDEHFINHEKKDTNKNIVKALRKRLYLMKNRVLAKLMNVVEMTKQLNDSVKNKIPREVYIIKTSSDEPVTRKTSGLAKEQMNNKKKTGRPRFSKEQGIKLKDDADRFLQAIKEVNRKTNPPWMDIQKVLLKNGLAGGCCGQEMINNVWKKHKARRNPSIAMHNTIAKCLADYPENQAQFVINKPQVRDPSQHAAVPIPNPTTQSKITAFELLREPRRALDIRHSSLMHLAIQFIKCTPSMNIESFLRKEIALLNNDTMTSNMIGIPSGVSMYELGNSVEAIIKQWQCKADPQPEVVDSDPEPEVVDLDPQLLIMTQSEPISVDDEISNGQESAAGADDDEYPPNNILFGDALIDSDSE